MSKKHYTAAAQREQRKNALTYNQIKADFKNYVNEKKFQKFYFVLVNPADGQVLTSDSPYVHRWTQVYRNRVLARMYKLEAWYNENPCPVTFLTFTTKQKDFSRLEDQFKFMKDSFSKIRDVMRKTYKARTGESKFNYFWVVEPHKTGNIHIHMMAFCEFTDAEKENFVNLWCDKYAAGRADCQKIEDIPVMEIDYLRTYLFKYLAKNLTDNTDMGYLIFSAVSWHMGRRDNEHPIIRHYGCSRELSGVMKLDRKNSEFECALLSLDGNAIYVNEEHTELVDKYESVMFNNHF